MNKLKMHGVQSHASNQLFRGFRTAVFSITDDRVSHRRKLRSDLILQSCHQLNPHERGICKDAFNGILKFGTGRVGVSRRPQVLKHPFASKIMNQRSCFNAEVAPHYREVLPHWRMGEKLSHERISIPIGFRKQQDTGDKPIDAMDDQGPLSFGLESR